MDTFETVQFKIDRDHRGKLDPQTSIGVWLGKSLTSDEHLIGTNLGIRRCRSVWRLKSRTKTLGHARLKAVVGTPWQPKGDSTIVPGQGSEPLGLERRERSVYSTLERSSNMGLLRTAPDATAMTGILSRTRRSAEKGSPSCIQRPELRRLERKVKWLWMRAEPLNNQALQSL